MLAGGIFLLVAALVRRVLQPNPTLNLSFLNSRNIIILALSIFAFKFVHLATIVLVPGFLGNVQQYRPLQDRTRARLGRLADVRGRVVGCLAWFSIPTRD